VNKFIIIVSLILGFSNLNAQKLIKVNTYKTTQDYISKTYTEVNVTLEVREITESYIRFRCFIDTQIGKKIKKLNSSWAIEYEGQNYFNLRYSSELHNQHVFIKMDIEGTHYCASFIGEDPPKVIKRSGMNYGGGLQGILLKSSDKWFTNWIDKSGSKNKILLIDLINQEPIFMSKRTISKGILLSKKDFKIKFGIKKSIAKIREMTFEEVIDLIKYSNTIN